MSERIKLTGSDNPADMFLVEAMVAVDDRLASFLPDDGSNVVEVALTINGKEVPFVEVARGFFERGTAQLDSDLLGRAKALVTAAGLDGIASALQDAEWKIEVALADALNKQATP